MACCKFKYFNGVYVFPYTGGLDFVNFFQTFSILASNEMQCVNISVLKDNADEANEVFLVNVDFDYAFSVLLDTYQITIVDTGEQSRNYYIAMS